MPLPFAAHRVCAGRMTTDPRLRLPAPQPPQRQAAGRQLPGQQVRQHQAPDAQRLAPAHPWRMHRPGAADSTHRITALLIVLLTAVLVTCSCVPSTAVFAAPGATASPGWLTPVPGLRIVKAFDKPEKNWNAGHRGIDVAALPGESVRAPASGRVTFAGKVAGTSSVSVDVGAYTVSFTGVDALQAKGDTVSVGDTIGTVSTPSHCANGCIHIGLWRSNVKKDYLDPTGFFSAGYSVLLKMSEAPDEPPTGSAGDSAQSGAGAWGGHANGRIPEVALCPLRAAPGHRQRCDAATAFDTMSAAYRQHFGTDIPVTDSYRDYQTQVVLKARKGHMAATPGHSNHGWGLAMDLGGGISDYGTAQHQWMRQNAPRFGWIHPGWARQSGSLPEPWHWEYRAR